MRRSPTVLLCLSLAAASCGASAPDDATESTSSPVLNGASPSAFPSNAPPVVAVYHGTKRPCTGTQLTRNGWVLTAAHCVVVDPNDYDGPLVPLSTIRATPPNTASPGLQPPANAVPAAEVHRPGGLDLALVRFPGLASSGHVRTALYFGWPNELNNRILDIWGYGRSVIGEPSGTVEDGTTGAGTLRWGQVRVLDGDIPELTHAPGDASNQETWRGDSGGPTLLRNGYLFDLRTGNHVSAPLLVSVHAWSDPPRISGDTVLTAAITWMNGILGWYYIKPLPQWDSQYLDVQGAGTAPGTRVWLFAFNDGTAQHWQFHPDGTIRNQNGMCLDVANGSAADGTQVWMWTCHGLGPQQWSFHPNNQIRNANGKCLTVNNTPNGRFLMMSTCVTNSSFDQQWTISASP